MKCSVKLKIQAADKVQERIVDLLEGQIFVLGRETESSMTNSGVSRKHCGLTVENGELLIIDTGSRNGTFLNDLEITRNILKENDVIRIGPYEMTVIQIVKTEVSEGLKKVTPPHAQPALGFREDTQTMTVAQLKALEDPNGEPEKSPDWWEKIPPFLRNRLEGSDFDFQGLPLQLKMAVVQPQTFFELQIFEGRALTSFLIIAFCGFWIGLFNIFSVGFTAPVYTTIGLPLFYALGCFVLYFFRFWIGIPVGYSQLLRFCTYLSIMTIPVSFASLVVPPLGLLFNLLLFIWGFFGFYTAYKPRLIPVAIVGTVSALVGVVIWFGMIGAMISPSKFRELSQQIQEPVTVNSVLDAPKNTEPVALAEAPQEIATRPFKPAVKGKLPPRSFIGEFRPGEEFGFWMQLAGPGFSREGRMNVVIKSVDQDGALVSVQGEIDSVKGVFEQKIGWVMDKGSIAEAGLKNANVNQIFNILVSHRVRMVLLGSTPADNLPKELQSAKPMKVAGLKADYFQGWVPVRSVASDNTTFDIAVSPQYGFPLFLQGRNPGTAERIYLTLKEFKK